MDDENDPKRGIWCHLGPFVHYLFFFRVILLLIIIIRFYFCLKGHGEFGKATVMKTGLNDAEHVVWAI